MNLVAPFGFYGWGNIGDEATLQGFARLMCRFAPKARVWVASQNPRHTARAEPHFRYYKMGGWDPRRRWARLGASGVVVAGGTPIMDVLGRWPLDELVPIMEAMHRRGKPISFVGIGTEHLLREESKRMVADQLARLVRHWTVRCRRDKERLEEYGVPTDAVTVAADMAWLLDPVSAEWGRQQLQSWGLADKNRLLGVNLLGENAVLETDPRLFEKVAEFLDAMVENYRVFVLFLANEIRDGEMFDTAAARRTRALMRHGNQAFIAPNNYLAPRQMLSLIANCHATVSMRYHFCLFSALQAVPFIALKRSDKLVDLCYDLDWPFGAELNDLKAANLITLFEEVEEHRALAVRLLNTRLAALHGRACRNTTALDALQDGKLAQTR
jgi:polysaccharide pyruvyl transferase WcaK-like protein